MDARDCALSYGRIDCLEPLYFGCLFCPWLVERCSTRGISEQAEADHTLLPRPVYLGKPCKLQHDGRAHSSFQACVLYLIYFAICFPGRDNLLDTHHLPRL